MLDNFECDAQFSPCRAMPCLKDRERNQTQKPSVAKRMENFHGRKDGMNTVICQSMKKIPPNRPLSKPVCTQSLSIPVIHIYRHQAPYLLLLLLACPPPTPISILLISSLNALIPIALSPDAIGIFPGTGGGTP